MLDLPKRVSRFVARKLKGEIVTYHHRSDHMATRHNDGFRNDPLFISAYARAVKAAGWDYDIPYRVHQALWCAARKVEGDFVELGTGRGFIMSAVLDAFPDHKAWLFDTFDSGWIGKQGASRYYATSFEDVKANFAEWPNVTLVRGDIFKTLPDQPIEQIAFLHVYLNAPEPEVFGIRQLWSRIPRGGAVLLDDYAYRNREPQYRAINDLAKELGFSVLTTATGQGIVVK